MLGLPRMRVEGLCWDAHTEARFLYSGPQCKGSDSGSSNSTARNSMCYSRNAKEHEKPGCSFSDTKHLESSMPQSNKERA